MLTLSNLLYGEPSKAGDPDETAYALKAPDPRHRRKRLEESANLHHWANALTLPPRDELVAVFDPDWSKRRSTQSNNELYLTVSQVEVKAQTRQSWLEYAAYLGWCAEAATSNLFFAAGATLYRDAALIYLKTLKEASDAEVERSANRLGSAEILQPVIEILEGFVSFDGALLRFGRLLADDDLRSVIDQLDGFIESVATYLDLSPGLAATSEDAVSRADPLVFCVLCFFKACGVSVFDPEKRKGWRKELPELQGRLRNTLDWLGRRHPRWRTIEANWRLTVTKRVFSRELKACVSGEGSSFLAGDGQELLARAIQLLHEEGPTSIDGMTLLMDQERPRALEVCAAGDDSGARMLVAFFGYLSAALAAGATAEARAKAFQYAAQKLSTAKVVVNGLARQRYARDFVPFPMRDPNVADSMAGWSGTPRLRQFLVGMRDRQEDSLAAELDELLREVLHDASLPDDFYTALANILGRKGYPGLAGLAKYHLALRQIQGGHVGTALGTLGLCFGMLEQAHRLDFRPAWYRWTYEIACHAATSLESLGPKHAQGKEMLKEIALLALKDLKRDHQAQERSI